MKLGDRLLAQERSANRSALVVRKSSASCASGWGNAPSGALIPNFKKKGREKSLPFL